MVNECFAMSRALNGFHCNNNIDNNNVINDSTSSSSSLLNTGMLANDCTITSNSISNNTSSSFNGNLNTCSHGDHMTSKESSAVETTIMTNNNNNNRSNRSNNSCGELATKSLNHERFIHRLMVDCELDFHRTNNNINNINKNAASVASSFVSVAVPPEMECDLSAVLNNEVEGSQQSVSLRSLPSIMTSSWTQVLWNISNNINTYCLFHNIYC